MPSVKPPAAPIVNAELAKWLGREPDPIEPLHHAQEFEFDHLVHTRTVESLLKHGRLVRLACRHFRLTKALHRTGCSRCGEMIRAGWDYQGFRELGNPDTFSWPGDPLRQLHEAPETDGLAKFDPTAS